MTLIRKSKEKPQFTNFDLQNDIANFEFHVYDTNNVC